MSPDDVQALVAANKPALDRACWDPAINSHPKGPEMVRVATEVRVASDGAVQELSVVGGDAYQGLAACVKKQLANWCFPTAREPSSLMFPIVFQKGDVKWEAVPAAKGKTR